MVLKQFVMCEGSFSYCGMAVVRGWSGRSSMWFRRED